MSRSFIRYLGDNFDFLKPLIRKLRANRILVSPDRPLFGFYPNNKLGPVFQVYIKRKKPGQVFYMSGTPYVDMELKIRNNRKVDRTLHLEVNKHMRIDLDAQPTQTITFEFGQAVKGPLGLLVSFEVNATNLFAEEDTAGC